MADDYAQRTERIKSLLNSYYGADGPPPAGGAVGGPSASVAPATSAPAGGKGGAAAASLVPGLLAMDSPNFNAEAHVAQLLRVYPLEKLMCVGGRRRRPPLLLGFFSGRSGAGGPHGAAHARRWRRLRLSSSIGR
jgi:hypothetical protein